MKPIDSRTDWDISLLEEVWKHIEDIAVNDLGLDLNPSQIEIVSAEQMLDVYATSGYPLSYSHWSFGKSFLKDQQQYNAGKMGLAYEMIIGTNPAIAYLMEGNDAVTQALVLAHACCGHNFVFKNNYAFKEAEQDKTLIDYLIYARDYVKNCEEKYGEKNVEKLLDIAHALSNNSVDRRPRKYKKKLSEADRLVEEAKKFAEEQQNLDIIIKKTSQVDIAGAPELIGDEDNLLYFIANNSIILEPWQREVLTIVRKIRQSFYPNMLTKLIHEGFATFVHVYVMNELEKRGLVTPDAMMSWIYTHSNVVFQPDMHSPYFDGSFNPYALGLDIFNDIRRICENPTKEDEEWFPQLVGKPWREEVRKAATEYTDESFIAQFLSPTIIRKHKIMLVDVSTKVENQGEVIEISDDLGYRTIRQVLSERYNFISHTPNITILPVDMKNDRTLNLEYHPYNNRKLNKHYAQLVVDMIHDVWGYDVKLRVEGVDDPMVYSS